MAHKTWLCYWQYQLLTTAWCGPDNTHWDFYRVIKIRQDSMSMHESGKCVREGGREGGERGDGACDVNVVVPHVGQKEKVSEGGGSCFETSAPP